MKKIFTFLLACSVVFSMAACAGGTAPDNTTPNQIEMPGNTNPADTSHDVEETTDSEWPDDTPAGEWLEKEVVAPAIQEPEVVNTRFSFREGGSYSIKFVKAPWFDTNVDEVASQLKAFPVFEGWEWSKECKEIGYTHPYSDIGQQNHYEYSVTLKGQKEYNSVYVTFSTDTSKFIGWSRISVSYNTSEESLTEEHQAIILPVLTLLYGDAAEYMAYAPITDSKYNKMSFSSKYDLGTVFLTREIDKNSVYFAMKASSDEENPVGFCAPKYTSMLAGREPEGFREIFDNFGTFNINDAKNIGSDFLRKWLKGYAYTRGPLIGSTYTYSVKEYNNGEKEVYFLITALVYQKRGDGTDIFDLELQYKIAIKDDEIIPVQAYVKVPAVGMSRVDTDPDSPTTLKYLQENLEYAKNVANAVFDTDINMDEVYWNGKHDNSLCSKSTMELCGIEKSVKFEFWTSSSAIADDYSAGVRIIIF